MREHWWFALVLWLVAVSATKAQSIQSQSASADTPALSGATTDGLAVPVSTTTNAVVHKHLVVSGPLVQPFKAKQAGSLPKRLWHLINPFAPTEPKVGYERTTRLSTRAWSTTVGWNSGGSVFPDPVTHEPTMSLISFSRVQ